MDSDTYNLLKQMLLDSNKEPTALPLSLLKAITNNFSEDRKIGSGGFADVYEGKLDNAGSVAVKRLFQTINMDENNFIKEAINLVQVKHQNIVRFLGYCSDTQGKIEKYRGKQVMAEVQQRLLCFEFMPNRSLDQHLSNVASGSRLEWMIYYQIIKGLCQGLHYLHRKNIVHLDLKPANILLDCNMIPKISDFGVSRCFEEKQTIAITKNRVGTRGYMAPEYENDGVITIKSDIYSLGIIIIEILTGKKSYVKPEDVLKKWSNRFQLSINGDLWLEHVKVCAMIGLMCMDSDPEKRPTTQEIIRKLDKLEPTGFIETNHSAIIPHEGPCLPGLCLNEWALRAFSFTRELVTGMVSTARMAAWSEGRICGTVELVKKDVLAVGDFHASLLDGVHRILGQDDTIVFQLVSATKADHSNGGRGTVGKPAHLEEAVVSLKSSTDWVNVFRVYFEWDKSLGIPGAVLVRNLQRSEVFLKKLTLEGVPVKGTVDIVANSWIYPHKVYSQERIFFANDTYLPSKMPVALVPYRQDELKILRGEDNPGPYMEHDRVYRYDYYNDLGQPDSGERYARPILGGSQEHPYPRRCRTGRQPTKRDPNSESTMPFPLNLNIYVPRDERVGHRKMSDSIEYSLRAIIEAVLPTLNTFLDDTPKEFDSFEDILRLYELGPEATNNLLVADVRKKIPSEFLRSLWPNDSHCDPLKMPLPNIIKSDVLKKAPEFKFGWRTDEEFARETLAGMNPVIIKRMTEFPAKSTLDPSQYGDHTSKITEAHIQHNLEGLPVQNALEDNRLFILDHHDHFMPYLNKINKLKGNFIYASRTLLFLKDDGTLKPLAIELSLPHPDGQQHGAVSKVYTPAHTGVEGHIWQLAKGYACVNDSAWHQLISHWLNTHAVIEPFVIATNRQLSVVHPVHKLLSPHYRETLNINALTRQTLIKADGIFERTLFPAKYALGMTSDVYKSWNFNEQALPADLVKRGVAVPDQSNPYGVRLLIKDYPYAVDGLVIWWAIERWVMEYLDVYYYNDGELQRDVELQSWWKEVREEAHGDLKDRDWWPRMDTVQQLARTCTTIIWVASALHAAVNFGQYPYAGYLPNRPTVSRRPMPEPGSDDYKKLEAGQKEADMVFIRTFTSHLETIMGISLIETLSKHASDEVYLGQRDKQRWTSDTRAMAAFKRFGSRLMEIEKRIKTMNDNPTLKNRKGPVEMPYMLLYPNTSDVTGEKGEGLTAMGIPNSISI